MTIFGRMSREFKQAPLFSKKTQLVVGTVVCLAIMLVLVKLVDQVYYTYRKSEVKKSANVTPPNKPTVADNIKKETNRNKKKGGNMKKN